MSQKPLNCPQCGHVLKSIDYQIWGTKRFDARTSQYKEDDSLGKHRHAILLSQLFCQTRSGTDYRLLNVCCSRPPIQPDRPLPGLTRTECLLPRFPPDNVVLRTESQTGDRDYCDHTNARCQPANRQPPSLTLHC